MVHDKCVGFLHDSFADLQLFLQHVAIDASTVFVMIPGRLVQLIPNIEGQNRGRDDLGMGVLQRGSRSQPMVLENDDQADARICFQGEKALTVGPENFLHLPVVHQGDAELVARALNHNLVSPNAVHLPEKPLFSLPFQAPFRRQRGKSVRHHTDPPAGTVRLTAMPVGHGLRRRHGLVTRTEWAWLLRDGQIRPAPFHPEVVGPPRTFRGDHDPLPGRLILSELRHAPLPCRSLRAAGEAIPPSFARMDLLCHIAGQTPERLLRSLCSLAMTRSSRSMTLSRRYGCSSWRSAEDDAAAASPPYAFACSAISRNRACTSPFTLPSEKLPSGPRSPASRPVSKAIPSSIV